MVLVGLPLLLVVLLLLLGEAAIRLSR